MDFSNCFTFFKKYLKKGQTFYNWFYELRLKIITAMSTSSTPEITLTNSPLYTLGWKISHPRSIALRKESAGKAIGMKWILFLSVGFITWDINTDPLVNSCEKVIEMEASIATKPSLNKLEINKPAFKNGTKININIFSN